MQPDHKTTREPERGPPFKACAKCEAAQDVALLCGPCADRFADHLMADPAFASTMAAQSKEHHWFKSAETYEKARARGRALAEAAAAKRTAGT